MLLSHDNYDGAQTEILHTFKKSPSVCNDDNRRTVFLGMDIDDKIMDELTQIDQPLGIISTVSQHGPESAAVYYIYDNAFSLYFITKKDSRKLNNIVSNPAVSFVIATENPPRTVQLEGKASIVTDPSQQRDRLSKLTEVASKHLAIPQVSEFEESDMTLVKVTPDWIRFGEFECMREKESEKFIETNLI